MAITIQLNPDTERLLRDRAFLRGVAPEEYLRYWTEKLVGKSANGTAPTVAEKFDALLTPIRREFEESGIETEEQIDAAFDESLKKVRAKRNKKTRP